MEHTLTNSDSQSPLPTPPSIPWSERLSTVIGLKRDPLPTLQRVARRHGDVVRMPIPGKRIYLVASPEGMQHVLHRNQKNYNRSYDFKILMDLLGEALLTSHGEVWRAFRKPVAPHFHRERMPDLLGPMVTGARDVFDRRVGNARGKRVELGALFGEAALEIVSKALFGTEVADDYEALASALLVAQREINARVVGLVDLGRLPTPARARFRRAVATMDAVIGRMLARRRALLDGPEPTPRDLLSVFFEMRDPRTGEPLSDTQIRDQVLTLFIAGHETTALGLSWAVLLLERAPEALAKAREELETVFGVGGAKDGREITADDLPRLPWLRAITMEAMRLYPPVWSLGREAIEEDVIAGYRIPAGSTIMVCQYVTHRDARFWERAEEFDPSRFLEDRSHEAYFPFGSGGRRCVGEAFAQMELVVVLAEFIRRYEFKKVEPGFPRLEPLITLRPLEAIDFYLTLTRSP